MTHHKIFISKGTLDLSRGRKCMKTHNYNLVNWIMSKGQTVKGANHTSSLYTAETWVRIPFKLGGKY